MFVSDLDRPWHETPFPIQGFVIRKQEQLDQLNRYCRTVYVDVAELRPQSKVEPRKPGTSVGNVLKLPAIQIRNPRNYTHSESLSEGIRHADHLLEDLSGSLTHIMDSLKAGKLPSFARVAQGVQQMCESIIRNPDALLWLSRVQHRDQYSYQHSLNATIWALVLGRQMGLEPDVLEHLGMGTLLCHIGKSRLPRALLVEESALSGEDLPRYQRYVTMGAKMLEQARMPKVVINIVQYHRERHNGRGFPQGVNGEQIPLLAKLAGLVDHYEG
ncbi:MAG: HD domain-containing phosphohydrolase, partial [Oleiphilaceae bacterium]|nr:HD domain-containing phosphohydrolase [Oleiphilaceae bacterium]